MKRWINNTHSVYLKYNHTCTCSKQIIQHVSVSEFCTMCSPGTYQDEAGQSSCKNCPAGHYSSSSKDRCEACEAGTYAAADGSGCGSCGSTTQCPCMGSTTLCYHADLCYNTDGGYGCLPCPTGYTGNGVTCTDINEV